MVLQPCLALGCVLTGRTVKLTCFVRRRNVHFQVLVRASLILAEVTLEHNSPVDPVDMLLQVGVILAGVVTFSTAQPRTLVDHRYVVDQPRVSVERKVALVTEMSFLCHDCVLMLVDPEIGQGGCCKITVNTAVHVVSMFRLTRHQNFIFCINCFQTRMTTSTEAQLKKIGGISYTAHGAQITPPPYFRFLFLCLI